MKTTPKAVVVWGLVCAALFAAPSLQALWIPGGSPICTKPNNQTLPTIVPDGIGGAFIAWTDVRDLDFDIYAQRVNERGAPLWATDGVAVCTVPGVQSYPQMIPDGSGGAIMAWHDIRDGSGDWDIYSQRIDANGTLMWPDTGVVVCDTTDRSENPVITPDGSGGAIVVWHDARGDYNALYAQRVDPGGNTLWGRNGVAITRFDDYENSAAIVSDGGGGAIVVWEDSRGYPDLYAQRVDPDGNTMWTAGGVAVCTAPLEQRNPVITTDGTGGAIIAWYDQRHTGVKTYVYVQRVDADGNTLWTADGDTICTTTYGQQYPVVVSDGAGGAIVVWNERQGSISDVHAQRIDANGDPLWTAVGVAVCTAAEIQTSARAVPDGSGGVVVAWQDERDSDFSDVYAQRISANGTVLWTTDGVAVCTANQIQENIALTNTGNGETIFAWEDARNSNWDIYGSLVNADGQLVPTLLESYEADLQNEAVVVRWTVSTTAPAGGIRFTVYRKESSTTRPWATVDVEIEGQGGTYSFADVSVIPGSSYWYRVDATDDTGHQTLLETEAVTVPAPALTLYQNTPNPFHLSTAVRYYLPRESVVTLRIYDNSGRLVTGLLNHEVKAAGLHVVEWDGRDVQKRRLASGVYFCQLKSGKFTATQKMVLLR